MSEREKLQDQVLTCADCGDDFTWEAGSQEYFREMGITSEPTRCQECRQASNRRRIEREASKGVGT